MKSNKTTKCVFTLLLSVFIALLFATYSYIVENRGQIESPVLIDYIISYKTLAVLIINTITVTACTFVGSEKIFKYRYIIASALFVIGVAAGITGSSIGMVTQYLGGEDNDILFGISRGIRSDEWALFTPLSWSQYYGAEPFSYFSNIVRATQTDVFLEYGQPIYSILMIFRPFQIGYLFLPVANGMAFFWVGRIIALFMVSFEFGRLITEDRRRVALIYAFAVTFAPAVQWWFAINGFIEMLIFMQLSIVMFDLYLKSTSIAKKSIYMLIIAVCAGGYVLAMYPAWMIPLAYILLVFIIWTFVKNKKEYKFNKLELIPMAVAAVVLAACALIVFKNSSNTIELLSSTVFPGKRVSTGGGAWEFFFNSINNIWYPLMDNGTYANACESAYFISLFPLGILLNIYYIIRTKKVDLLSIMLFVVSVFLGIYCFVGLPEALAKITMMGNSLANRALVILTFNDLILLVRSIHLMKKAELKIHYAIVAAASVVIAAGLTYKAYTINKDYFIKPMIIVEFFVVALAIAAVTAGISYKKTRTIGTIYLITAILLTGLLVNPIRKGVDSVSNLPVLQGVRDIVNGDPDAIWIVEEVGYPFNNFLIMEGARTINCTNIYPDLDRWEELDEEEDDSEIYNRYAHIQIIYDNAHYYEEFSLVYPDVFSVSLDDADLDHLDVDYVFTTNGTYEGTGEFELIYSYNGFFIYKNV